MKSVRFLMPILPLLLFTLLPSCSSQKADYEEVQKVLSATDQTIQQTADYDIRINQIYSVRMRGALLGTSIFKLAVYTSGRIAMDSKSVSVDDRANVEE